MSEKGILVGMSEQLHFAPAFLPVHTQPPPQDPAELYLDLMKRILTRALTANGLERHTIQPVGPKSRLLYHFNRLVRGVGLETVRLKPSCAEDYIESGHEATNRAEDAETMLGTRQLDHMQRCIVDVLTRNVPGDFMEAGVWRGGMAIFMRAVLKAYQVKDRKVWAADSFAGLPPIDPQHNTSDWKEGDMSVSLATVKSNFARYGLLDEQVKFLPGFFSETLPTAPVRSLSILRVDADLYGSTMDVLGNLYSALSVGGYTVLDDYQNLPDCRRAIDEFRRIRGITEEICQIDRRAVYWQKRA